jgi:RNA polymerase sigma-70 factor (ECF subfamily)
VSLSPDDLSAFRNRLLAFCYQLLASPFEAEDEVQDTMERAWAGPEV